MEAQVNFIERLEEKTRDESSDLSTLVDYCAEQYGDLNLFMPKMTGLTTDTYLFTSREFCMAFAQTITEIKSTEVGGLEAKVLGPNGKVVETGGVRMTNFAL